MIMFFQFLYQKRYFVLTGSTLENRGKNFHILIPKLTKQYVPSHGKARSILTVPRSNCLSLSKLIIGMFLNEVCSDYFGVFIAANRLTATGPISYATDNQTTSRR